MLQSHSSINVDLFLPITSVIGVEEVVIILRIVQPMETLLMTFLKSKEESIIM
jgi:hypothetical protein